MSYSTSGLVEVVLNNDSATTNPTVSNDSTQGYSVQSRWTNTVSDTEFVCTDASAGAAVWKPITLGRTFAHPLNMWPQTANLNEWYGPNFWQNLNDGAYTLARSFGTGPDPVVGNYQIQGLRVPFDCILERIELYGYINSLSNNLEIRWDKFSAADNVAGLSGQVQVGVTTTITNEPNMRDFSQDVGAVLNQGDFLVPFFRESGLSNQNGQFMGQLVFRELL